MGGAELAVSESQERMAAIVAESDAQTLIKYAESENIEATVVARITERKRLVMTWRGEKIVDIDRAFLDTNGAARRASVVVSPASRTNPSGNELNFCSQRGLAERFDHSIGAGSVFEPFGGKYALTETQVMASLLPAPGTNTASAMAPGFDPHITEADPFGGSVYAVVSSAAKLVAAGVPLDTIHLSLQEYFPNLRDDPSRWGVPFAAMLGAFSAQMGLKIAAIGGKDSMSGSFGGLDVPPTLISFAVGIGDASVLISPEFKSAGHPVYLLETPLDSDGLPDYQALLAAWERYAALLRSGKILSAWSCEADGVYGGILKMALGNMLGFSGDTNGGMWGSIVFEASEKIDGYRLLGHTQEKPELNSVPLCDLRAAWESPLESVFPVKTAQDEAPLIKDERRPAPRIGVSVARPKAVLPVFPGTNCEYDTAAAIERAGGIAETVLIRNLTLEMLQASITELERAIKTAQMMIFPGGFSGGDEPDGSGKFIVSLFKNPRLTEAVHDLLQNRDGLILGICNGFQALIKLGLVPYGKIIPMTANCPTLTRNTIGRHIAKYVTTRVASVNSPWLSRCRAGELYTQPISHGEGRFVATEEVLNTLKTNGQIVFQYTDNPNGSVWAIEGICSPCGRVLGKMTHAERVGKYVAKNVPGNKYLPLFEGGVEYFR
jgi:phosphoribosylformylglycinamidine synthase